MHWSQYVEANFAAMKAVDEKVIFDFYNILANVRDCGGKIWVLGNGGSASTAAHTVGDFGKTSKAFGARPLMALAPSEMTALQTAYSNDESFSTAFASMLSDFGEAKDAVWLISVSGTSPNLVAAQSQAKASGMRVLSTVGKSGLKLASESDVGIVIDSEDYQVVENVHLILMHWLTKLLSKN
jgi:D-sedoheptulose 7-phosphate isomerase